MRDIKPKQDEYMEKIGTATPMKKQKSPKIYPTIRLDLEHIPEAKKWEIGKKYPVETVLKMTGISQSRFDNSAEFELHKIGPGEAVEEEDDDDDEGEDKP